LQTFWGLQDILSHILSIVGGWHCDGVIDLYTGPVIDEFLTSRSTLKWRYQKRKEKLYQWGR
jgi:hypothetical protein